jgi:transcriptional regulator with XRE-family HTH domain
MHNPPHPGEVLQDTVLGENGISVSEFARNLGVSRVALSRVVNARAAVSADMAFAPCRGARWQRGILAADASSLRPLAGSEKAPAEGYAFETGGVMVGFKPTTRTNKTGPADPESRDNGGHGQWDPESADRRT